MLPVTEADGCRGRRLERRAGFGYHDHAFALSRLDAGG